MHMNRLLAVVAVAVMAAACGSASGGGWIPSAVDPTKKATFGFAYTCDASTNHLQGHLEYHDHGVGLRAVVAIDQAVPSSVGCTTPEAGVTAACGIVQSGSGGVSPNDVALVATGDAQSTETETEDALAIVLFTGGSASVCTTGIQNCASQPTVDEFLDCLNSFELGEPYYLNTGTLGAGNIVMR